ncbi:DUF2254 domain-containing protein [Halobacillus sp. Nhm2S1]|uniref:DUF2254 domain-containing protein n=1 Tax=Halobacillus sp. Nhm2S1 TaxID=2866716 RepID=UPI001C72BFDA|nr:DUF2254 domain-containing protein [Halobacillus sp. Nhm2S1]MBX0357078.1 DUF2254 domain-containing protein [Halobacillus sp. Nhm2S1]
MNKGKVWINLRDSFWFLPTIYSILSIIAVALTALIDQWIISEYKSNIPSLFLTKSSVAQTLYGSMVTSILTMTTISFSTIMVVLTTYTTQFSPRTLQDFMKSRVTQHVLGVFSFGFIFSLINLFLLGKEPGLGLVSPLFTVIVSIICLAFFILFIHHSSRFLKVNNLIGAIRKSTSTLITKTFKEKNYQTATEWNDEKLQALDQSNAHVITAEKSGYVQNVQYGSLIKWAKNHTLTLETSFLMGDYIQKGMPLFYYWKNTDQELSNPQECTAFVLIGNERIDTQDVEFSIQKLVEIAVRAISPSLNDPHTATNCINRIGSLLIELGSVYEPIRYYIDDDDELRLIAQPKSFEEYLYKSFYQIKIYGYHDISVMNSVLESLYKIAAMHDQAVQEDVWTFGKTIINAVKVDELDELDYKRFNNQVKKLAKACNKDFTLQKQ